MVCSSSSSRVTNTARRAAGSTAPSAWARRSSCTDLTATSVCRQDAAGPLLCLAGGSGLAPILSIVRHALATGYAEPIELILSVRDRSEAFALDALHALARRHANFTYRITLTRAREAAPGWRLGRIPDWLGAELPGSGSTGTFWPPGRPASSRPASPWRAALGAADERILTDSFTPTIGCSAARSSADAVRSAAQPMVSQGWLEVPYDLRSHGSRSGRSRARRAATGSLPMSLASARSDRVARRPESAPLLPFGLNKLSVRLLLLVLLTAVPVFAVEAYYELQLREQRRTEIGQQVQQMADLVAGQLDRMIEGAQTVLVTLGQLPAVRERDAGGVQRYLDPPAARFPNVDAIGVVGPDGGRRSATAYRGRRACPLADRPYFQRALETKSLVVSDLLVGQLSGRKQLALAQPTLDERGAVETVLSPHPRSPRSCPICSTGCRFPQDATIGVLDRQGHRVAPCR